MIYDLAGTGKTMTVMTRIQRISYHIKPMSIAICPTVEENVKGMVKKLEASNVVLTHITFAKLATSSYSMNGEVSY